MSKQLLSESYINQFRRNAGLPLLESVQAPEQLDELSNETMRAAQTKRSQQLQDDPNHKSGEWFQSKKQNYAYDKEKQAHVPVDRNHPGARQHDNRDAANIYHNNAQSNAAGKAAQVTEPLVQEMKKQASDLLINQANKSNLNGALIGLTSTMNRELVLGPLNYHPKVQAISSLILGDIQGENNTKATVFLIPKERSGIELYTTAEHLRAIQALLNMQINLAQWLSANSDALYRVANTHGPQGVEAMDKSTLPPMKNFMNRMNQEVNGYVQVLSKEQLASYQNRAQQHQ